MSSLRTIVILFLYAAVTLTNYVAKADEGEMSEQDSLNMNSDQSEIASVVEELFKTWEERLEERINLETRLTEQGRVLSLNTRKTDSSMMRNINADPKIRMRELKHLPFEDVSEQLYKRFNITQDDLQNIDLTGEYARQNTDACNTANVNCDVHSRYRRIDGQCNNLRNPTWGSARTCQPRLLSANYVGNSGFRVSENGGPLPNPRQLSLNIHSHDDRPENCVNHMYMFFGQLLDHDIVQTPQSTTVDNQAINCCPPETETHPQCAPILVSEDDPFYRQFNIRCINFVRSAICPTCVLGPRQVMNQVTSTIDASFIYDNTENATRALRTNDGTGRLRVQRSRFGDLLPRSPDPINDRCSFPETNEFCFQSGDSRVNQHTVLTSLHTIFHLEHNRIASALRQINPRWNGERLFQETRRILGAQMQAITYKEYLPITIGNERMSHFNLWTGMGTRYDPNQNPTTLLEFTTAAFRFGHSLINSIMTNRPLNDTNERRFLRNEFFQPFELYRGLIGPLVSGVSNSPAQTFDRHLVEDVTNHLYRVRGAQSGLDLAAININRGRDHGMPTYVDTISYCSNGKINITNFDELVTEHIMQREQADVLYRNYRSVKDIDLWTGIVNEINKNNAVVGPTAVCIIGIQFNKMKYGDRFYFEHMREAGSFTNQQVQELRKSTLSQIICLNTDAQRMPANAMIFASRNNPYIQCRNVRGIDLSYWRE